MKRGNGILMHISSLANNTGIGTLGKCAFEFVDFLKKAGQSYWQLLPICPTGFGDSPYSSFSTFAGNPYFIDLDLLREDGLLELDDYQNIRWSDDEERVDYGRLYQYRFKVLRKAVTNFLKNPDTQYYDFIKANKWVNEYALFMSIKDSENGKCWLEWPDDLKNRRRESIEKIKEEYHEEIEFHMVIQYLFYKQWNNLKSYANTNGIKLIGDCPIYIALDSADVWINTSLFQLDENNIPTRVAGCPPDGFSATGQLWGNPLYDWDRMKTDNYKWWIKRIEHLSNIYDIVRIDHFRGFESYYAIPYGEENAINGTWLKGPGMDLFNAIKKELGDIDIIAEDLGFITEEVHKLLDDSGFPGMKVLEFAFDSRDANGPIYYPHNYPKNCIAYVGTHDNETIMGWKGSIEDNDLVEAKKYMMIEDDNDFNWKMISVLMMSVANTTILQAQDILGLDNKARMNTPSTTGINWVWRAKEGSFNDELALKLYSYTKRYARIA